MKGAAKRLALEVVGWTLVVAGIAALVLPGPGLLMLFGGLAVLSQQYEWAERRLAPIKYRALKGAAESVETWPRIVMSVGGVLLLIAAGSALGRRTPRCPSGGRSTSAGGCPAGWPPRSPRSPRRVIAFALIVYSYRRFHGNPEAVAELEEEIVEADEEAHWRRDDS